MATPEQLRQVHARIGSRLDEQEEWGTLVDLATVLSIMTGILQRLIHDSTLDTRGHSQDDGDGSAELAGLTVTLRCPGDKPQSIPFEELRGRVLNAHQLLGAVLHSVE